MRKNLLTGPEASASFSLMSHRSSAHSGFKNNRIAAAEGARALVLISLVLVLLITNGGAG
jgi:hypothetical protein